jgi:transposase
MQKVTTARKTRQQVEVQPRCVRNQIRERAAKERLTVGLDLGDRNSAYCIVSEAGEILLQSTLPTTQAGLGQVWEGMPPCRIALEVGTHSPWVSRYLSGLGHEVIVANAREVAYITRSTRKSDRLDAEKLARLARVDVKLLSPIRHRSEQAQADRAILRARDVAVRQRTRSIAAVRGMAKSLGERLKRCAPEAAGVELVCGSRAEIRRFAEPLLEIVEKLNTTIAGYDREILEMEKRYAEVKLLKQVYGVGPVIGMALILTVEDPHRFRHSRDIGPFLGLRPKKRDSGQRQPELGISKEGDKMVRWLLVQAAHTILRRGAADSDLRRWGLGLLAQAETEKKKRGGRKSVKKKIVVAVARKLAVLLHHLWVTGEVYEPLRNARAEAAAAA